MSFRRRVNRPVRELHGEEDQEVRALLVRIAPVPAIADPLRIFRLPSFTNRTFLIECSGSTAYVLRLPGPGTEQYIDRASEVENARAAESIGLAPQIAYADPSSGIMISVYLAGAHPLSAGDLRDRQHFQAVIDTLKRLHDSGVSFRGEMRLYPKLDQYLAIASTPELRALRRAGDALRSIVESGWGALKPCHIDPAPHNFMAAPGGYRLLDWEYSAMCEPVWDLAGLSIEGRFNAAQDGAMVERYFRIRMAREHQRWMSRVHIYRILLRLIAAAWGAVQIELGNAPWSTTEFVDPLLAQSAADLGSAELGRHIATAA